MLLQRVSERGSVQPSSSNQVQSSQMMAMTPCSLHVGMTFGVFMIFTACSATEQDPYNTQNIQST